MGTRLLANLKGSGFGLALSEFPGRIAGVEIEVDTAAVMSRAPADATVAGIRGILGRDSGKEREGRPPDVYKEA